jgi:hypothetical protein
MKASITAICLLCVSVGSAAAGDLKVTVYNSDIGVVRDVRSVRLERGQNEVSIDEIAARIDPTSVRLNISAQGQIDVAEQNFEYDLVSPDKLLGKYLEDRISITTEEGKHYEGTLLGFDSRSMVVDLAETGVGILSRGKITDVVLPPGKKGLVVKPTLFWKVTSSRATSAEMELAYITEGMNWHAEYVAAIGDDETSLGLASWVSVENSSGAAYPDAKLKLIAGEVHRVEKKVMPLPEARAEYAAMAAPRLEEKAFFEYHMYTLEGTTTLKDKEVKQIQLFPETSVDAEKQYNYDSFKGRGTRVVMVFENTEDSGLGIPLPRGTVRVFKADVDGSLEFIGEDEIDHTPKDEEVKLYVGDAFDIVVDRERTDFTKVSDHLYMETFGIEIANHKGEDIMIIVTEHIFGDWSIRKNSHPYEKIRSDTVEFEVPVEANGTAVLTYTVRRKV